MTSASEDGPRLLARGVLLRDGSTLRLRAPVPSDFGDIRAFYDGLSPESRYFRFHGYGRTERGIRRFDAEVMPDNYPMLGVRTCRVCRTAPGSFGELTVSLDITPTEAVRERIDERDHRRTQKPTS